MRVAQEKVRLFHEKHGYAAPDRPVLIDQLAVDVRALIMGEELGEYVSAATRGDLVEVADGLADLLYTVLGTAVVHGIDLAPIFEEVHRSNMTKETPPADRPDKPFKNPLTFQRPRIGELLFLQQQGLDAHTV